MLKRGDFMSGSLTRLLTGRRFKYVVILFWLAVVAITAPLAGKLSGAEKNDIKSWLPGSAESTQVLDVQARFASPNTMPAVVVYERTSGLTAADQAKIAADAGTFGNLPDLDGKVTGPIPSPDGQVAQLIVPLDLGPQGWSKAGDLVDSLRTTAGTGAAGMTVHVTGPAGSAADSSKAFEGIDCPVRIVWGTKDRVIPHSRYARRLRDLIPAAEYVELEGLGHCPMVDDPPLIARTILEVTAATDRQATAAAS